MKLLEEKQASLMKESMIMSIKTADALQHIVEEIRHTCAFDFIKLALLKHKNESDQLPVIVSGNTSMRYLRIVVQTRMGLAGIVSKTGRPAFIYDAETEINEEDRFRYPIIMAEGLKSLGALPLLKDGEVIGVVLAGFRGPHQMTEGLIASFKKEVYEKITFE